MRFMKALMAGTLALSMTSAPVLAQPAAPLSIAAMAQGDGEGASGTTDYLFPALAIIAVLTAAILLTGDDKDDFGNPTSP